MVTETESELTSVEEVESALRLFRKLIDEVETVEATPVQRAVLISNLYRTFQEFAKELQAKREAVLLEAAIQLADEEGGGPYFSRSADNVLAFHNFRRGLDKLGFRVNR